MSDISRISRSQSRGTAGTLPSQQPSPQPQPMGPPQQQCPPSTRGSDTFDFLSRMPSPVVPLPSVSHPSDVPHEEGKHKKKRSPSPLGSFLDHIPASQRIFRDPPEVLEAPMHHPEIISVDETPSTGAPTPATHPLTSSTSDTMDVDDMGSGICHGHIPSGTDTPKRKDVGKSIPCARPSRLAPTRTITHSIGVTLPASPMSEDLGSIESRLERCKIILTEAWDDLRNLQGQLQTFDDGLFKALFDLEGMAKYLEGEEISMTYSIKIGRSTLDAQPYLAKHETCSILYIISILAIQIGRSTLDAQPYVAKHETYSILYIISVLAIQCVQYIYDMTHQDWETRHIISPHISACVYLFYLRGILRHVPVHSSEDTSNSVNGGESEVSQSHRVQSADPGFSITPQDADILQEYLQEFQAANTSLRTRIIEKAMAQLYLLHPASAPFDKKVATKRIQKWFYNHYVRPRCEYIKFTRKWSARNAFYHLHHDEVLEYAKEESGREPGHPAFLGALQDATTALWNEVSPEDQEEYVNAAKEWSEKTPPKHVQSRMASSMRERIIQDFQSQLYRTCGIRSIVLTAYEGEDNNLKVGFNDASSVLQDGRDFRTFCTDWKSAALWEQWTQFGKMCFAKEIVDPPKKDLSRTIKTPIPIILDTDGCPELPTVAMSDGYKAKVVQSLLRDYCTTHIRYVTRKPKLIIPWGSLVKDPSSWISDECTPDHFEWKDPSKIQIGEVFRILDHWRHRQDQGIGPLMWVPTSPLFDNMDDPPRHGRSVQKARTLQSQGSDEEYFVLPNSPVARTGKKPQPDRTATANNRTSGCGWSPAQRAVVASPSFLPLVSWWDAAGVASVADTIELAFLHRHGWDGAWRGIDGGVVAIVAGCMQGSTPTTSLKLYATTNHPRDPTSRDPNHDDGSNKWCQRSLSNDYNTNSGSNTTTSSQLRPPHLGTGEYKARSTATTAGKVTTTTARHGEATTTDSKTKSAATTTSPRKSPRHLTVRHDNSEGEQYFLYRPNKTVLAVAYTENQYHAAVVGWNQFQLTTTGRTTDDNRSVVVQLSVVPWPGKDQPVAVSVVAKRGKKPDPTGPEITKDSNQEDDKTGSVKPSDDSSNDDSFDKTDATKSPDDSDDDLSENKMALGSPLHMSRMHDDAYSDMAGPSQHPQVSEKVRNIDTGRGAAKVHPDIWSQNR
ncbi:hypothetical protein EDB89DRAFT_1909818 [Lactarius sanguifluus]|nr:hypothetical protein EDB89DRAFT_1909818 [Lactarius sanguifluus]